MARVGRIAGALLAETGGRYYLVGNPKVPCDWQAHGFEPPGELDARVRPVVPLMLTGAHDVRSADEDGCAASEPEAELSDEMLRLRILGETSVREADVRDASAARSASAPVAPALGTPQLALEVEGDALPRLLADAFVIPRTGSVSERLWRLVTGESDESDAPPPDVIFTRWLGELPPAIWHIVRDTVLRCS